MPKYYVYVLRSLSDRQFYVGLTDNLPARLQEHNAGRVRSTKQRVPFELLYWECCLNRSDAAQREKLSQDCMGQALSKSKIAKISHGVNPVT
jgi:putative endonuclease